MREWFAFLENFSLDDQLYFLLPRRNGQNLELAFRREEATPWRLRTVGNLFWQETSSDRLEDVLAKEEVDLSVFATALRQCILQQGAFAAFVQREVERLFGQEVVTTVADNETFLKELADTVATMIPETEARTSGKPTLKLIKS